MTDGPRIFAAWEWSAIPVDNRRLDRSPAVGVVLHHTGSRPRAPYPTPDQERRFAFKLARAIQRDHMERNGWRDSGQSFTVTRGGVILEGRVGSLDFARKGLVLAGAHAGNAVANRTRHGIEVEGNTDTAPPTPDQWRALVELCAHLSLWGRYQARELEPHQRYRATECPGTWFMRNLERLALEIKARKSELLLL